ncbi:MAG: HTH domain-containing protein [Polyangiaceae bacterium]
MGRRREVRQDKRDHTGTNMTFTEAAAEVLRMAGKPLHYKEITELAIEKNLLSHVGKSPEVTMGARLAALLKKEDEETQIVRVRPGVFALRDWSKKGKAKAEEAPVSIDDVEVNALEVEAATRANEDDAPDSDDEDAEEAPVAKPVVMLTGEDALRADLAASGADLFDDEEDDDEPILAAPQSTREAADGVPSEGGRRRRRRRRRGRGGQGADGEARPSTPDATADAEVNGEARDPLAPAPRPMIRERHQIMAGGAPTGIDVPPGEAEELAGRELADATVMILSGFDRSQGPVQARSLVDALLRRGRLSGDAMLAQAQLLACLRADNLRRQAQGRRPRFRFGQGPRVALTDWSLNPDLVRLEQEAIAAVDRYRDSARRTMIRKLQELPGHALIELALLGLEAAGMTNVRSIKRPGAPGGEAHFAALHRTGSDEIRTAIVVRKDGREIGRERVSDLRGALHHYGPASAGWLLTTGQVLSGAREEACAQGAAPIALFDGTALCRLFEDHDVGVVRTRISTAMPDLELYETLRGG